MVEESGCPVSSAREEILARVRKSLGTRPPEQEVVRAYRQAGELSEAEKIDLFVSRLEDYNAGVYRCAPDALPATIATALEARGRTRMLIPVGLPAELLPQGFEFIREEQFDYAAIDRMEGALTAATAAIAMTGSIILTHSETEGRRALTLIPDYHLCIVRTSQLVETVPEGIRALGSRRTSPVTTIAGPSATADIEMTRVKGVHGPRTLDVIIVS
jgi:L-lactate dehydrogenase complex protein LldG